CNDIVFLKGAQMGDVRQQVTDRHGQVEELREAQVTSLARRAAHLAEQKGHPVAVAVKMVDPDAVVVEAKDAHTGAVDLVLQSQAEADPARYVNPLVRKEAGQVLTVSDEDAVNYRLGQVVNSVEDFKALYGLRGKAIRIDGPTWVD